MNILIGATYQSPYAGNFIASLLELAEREREQGNNIFFIFPLRKEGERPWANWLRSFGYRVEMLDVTLPEAQQLACLKELTETNKISLFYFHFGFLQRMILRNRKVFKDVKVFFHDHMGFSTEVSLKKQILRSILRSGYYKINHIGVVFILKEKYKAYCLLGDDRWLVPNGISFHRLSRSDQSRVAVRRALSIPQESQLFLMLAWDMRVKGADVAIRAAVEARKKAPKIELAIVIQENRPTENDLIYLREATGLDVEKESWIHFIPSTEDIFSYYLMADGFISASRSESFSYGVLEAISQNRPVILSNIPGTKWAETYTKSAVYPVEDPFACAEAMLQLEHLAQAPTNADEIIDKYSIDKWCVSITNILHS